MEFEFRRRYLLPPRDPRFAALTLDEILVDVWAHRFADDPKLAEEEVNEDFEGDMAEWESGEGIPPLPDEPSGRPNEPSSWDPGDFETVADESWG